MNLEGGYTRLLRRVWSHPAFRSKVEASVFVWMVSTAQWREIRLATRWGPVSLGVGELLIAERELAEDWGLSRKVVRGLLQRLQEDRTIDLIRDRAPHRAGTVCRIVNYAEYQGVADHSQDAGDRMGTASGTASETASATENNQGRKEGRKSPVLRTGAARRARPDANGQRPLPLPLVVVAGSDAPQAPASAEIGAEPPDVAVKRQLWEEGRGIVMRICPDATKTQVGDLVGSAAKKLGSPARAIQALRDAEHAAASADIGGSPYRWLWGVVHDRAGTSTARKQAPMSGARMAELLEAQMAAEAAEQGDRAYG